VLVLPPYQGRGLGRHALLEVYALASRREEVLEVTVEDPCPGFQRLRDAVDMEWALLVHKLSALRDKIVAGGTGAGVDSSLVVEVTQMARDLQLVPAQVQCILNTNN
jgi:hypothetical protein